MNAEHLIRRRKALGLSGPALAREIGVSESTLWRWENRDVQPNAVMDRHVEQVLRRLERRRAAPPPAGARSGEAGEG
jgi:transcriptional regulator with XRE-family HTH domain